MDKGINSKESLLGVLRNARKLQKLSAETAAFKVRVSELNQARQTQKSYLVNVPVGVSVVLVFA
jgi:hypothetical protein